ncbi:MAG TPA: hypothetical protein VKS79_22875 [Gemmataceae bacterium]|nr:hypothetical protein [Gemmataceae bacterium]
MSRVRLLALTALAAILLTMPGVGQTPPATKKTQRFTPKLEPVAETRLLMEGMVHPNFQALEKTLKGNDIDKESWTFARGQSLLIAEAGNLLMLRPPNNAGQDSWMKDAMELRTSATELARVVSTQNRLQSRTSLVLLSNTCNNCHQTFRVPASIKPFDFTEEKKP